MVEKNLKKLQAKKRRVTNGFNTGTRDMRLKTAYRRNKRWLADEDANHSFILVYEKQSKPVHSSCQKEHNQAVH